MKSSSSRSSHYRTPTLPPSNGPSDILAASGASAHPSSPITPLRYGCQQDVVADTVLDWCRDMGGEGEMFMLHSAGAFSASAASGQGVFAPYDRLTIATLTAERACYTTPSPQTTWRWCCTSMCRNGFSSRRSSPPLFLPTFRRAHWNAHRETSFLLRSDVAHDSHLLFPETSPLLGSPSSSISPSREVLPALPTFKSKHIPIQTFAHCTNASLSHIAAVMEHH
ncbi:hypothetical protein BD311DRAFT_768751 [Dichomitus squalens]|uniref:Uncharacterized protein n=1 Tax=Dichomitus squalens TaxID=114155 RepID=A0A4Q9MC78_9APHY|nr:hypothetical protein BD311DRAFT_768751 [Dichomitus squalens]